MTIVADLKPVGVRAWLLSLSPASRRQARIQRAYIGWLAFRGNPIAMTGLVLIVCLVLVAGFAPWLTKTNGWQPSLAERPASAEHWWVPTIPGIAIFTVSLGFCLLGDGLRDVLDPKSAVHERAAEDRGPPRHVHDAALTRRGGAQRLVRARPRAPRHRRRVGELQVADRPRAPAPRGAQRPHPRPAHGADGIDLLAASERALRDIRGARISMIMQDPRYSLNPVVTVGEQISEAFLIHSDASRREARERTVEMLPTVQIRDPERVYGLYPHEVSGGVGQRVMIAMMLIPELDVIIADEPTIALDVTVQMQVLALLDDMVRERGMGLRRPQEMLPVLEHDPAWLLA